jgi:uncharacterized heparinase superfamily protein
VASKKAKKTALPPRKSAADLFFSSALYKGSLKNRTPKRLLFTPTDIVPGQSERADNLFHGNFHLEGLDTQLAGKQPWQAKRMPLYWHTELHKFNWIRDFSANGSDSAKRHVRALITSWIQEFEDYEPYIWDASILARRLLNWMQQSSFLLTSNDGDFNYKFLKSLRQQHQHLKRYCRYLGKEPDQFMNHMALYLGAACFKDSQGDAAKFKEKLLADISKIILSDGIHISRNPSVHLQLLTDLINLRESFRKQDHDIPQEIISGIDRLAPVIRFFQHGDGKLALFNGGYSCEDGECDQILAVSDAMGRAPLRCPQGGFERLKAGRALVILETGEGGRSKDLSPYNGIGSFEFSHGRDRIVVNCGAHPDRDGPWGKALGATAAHSTLSISDKNAEFLPLTKEGRPASEPVITHEEGGNLWLEFENNGYLQNQNVTHTRRLYMVNDGTSLRGEDTIGVQHENADGVQFDLRFHLHPGLSVSKSMGGRNLMMITPDGVGWQFLSSLSAITLEESIYCSQPGESRKTAQIKLSGRIHGTDSLTVKWAFHLMGEQPDPS